jgi:hypothetical protein
MMTTCKLVLEFLSGRRRRRSFLMTCLLNNNNNNNDNDNNNSLLSGGGWLAASYSIIVRSSSDVRSTYYQFERLGCLFLLRSILLTNIVAMVTAVVQ